MICGVIVRAGVGIRFQGSGFRKAALALGSETGRMLNMHPET
jgi:hypothetical protein